MQFERTFLIVALLVIASHTYSPQITQLISLNLSATQIIYSYQMEIVSGSANLYTLIYTYATDANPTVSNMTLLKHDISGTLPILSASIEIIDVYFYLDATMVFPANPSLDIFPNCLTFTYMNSNLALYYRLLFDKSNMVLLDNITSFGINYGTYLSAWNLYFYYDLYGNTGILNNLQSAAPGFVAIGSSDVKTDRWRYIFNTNQTLLLRFRKNTNQFIVIPLNGSVNNIASTFLNPPASFTFGLTANYSCACMNTLETILYVFDAQTVSVYNLITFSLNYTMVVKAPSIVTSCFYDESTTSVILVEEDISGTFTNFHSYDVVAGSLTSNILFNLQFQYVLDNTKKHLVCNDGASIYVLRIEGQCPIGTTLSFVNNTCVQIHCPVMNCLFCGDSIYCKVCNSNFTLINNLCLSNLTANTTANLTANTTANLTANTTANLTMNTTANLTANTTANVTANATTNTTTNSTTALNLTFNSSQSTSYAIQNIFIIGSLLTSSTVSTVNRLPSSRQSLSILFSYFSNFQDFWLFQYHNRDYGPAINNIFQTIRQFSQSKWQVIDSKYVDQVYALASTTSSSIQNDLDNRVSYSGANFVKWEGNGQSFLTNSWLFLTVNLTVVIALFIILKIVFNLLFHYKISIFVRPYSFWGYLPLVLLDGNLQYLLFFLFSQSFLSFSFNFSQKIKNVITFFIFFLLVIYSVCGYLLAYAFYKKNIKYFSENSKSNLFSTFYLTFQNGVKHLMFAAIHNLLRNQTQIQLFSLLGLEMFILIGTLILMKQRSFFKFQTRIWIYSIFSVLKIAIISLLLFQQYTLMLSEFQDLLQQVLINIFIIYAMVYCIGIFMEVVIKISEIKVVRECFKEKQEETLKQEVKVEKKSQNIFDPASENHRSIKLKQKFSEIECQQRQQINVFQIKQNSIKKVELIKKQKNHLRINIISDQIENICEIVLKEPQLA